MPKIIEINSCFKCPLKRRDERASNQYNCGHPDMKLHHISNKTISTQVLSVCPLKNNNLTLKIKQV